MLLFAGFFSNIQIALFLRNREGCSTQCSLASKKAAVSTRVHEKTSDARSCSDFENIPYDDTFQHCIGQILLKLRNFLTYSQNETNFLNRAD